MKTEETDSTPIGWKFLACASQLCFAVVALPILPYALYMGGRAAVGVATGPSTIDINNSTGGVVAVAAGVIGAVAGACVAPVVAVNALIEAPLQFFSGRPNYRPWLERRGLPMLGNKACAVLGLD